MDVSSELAAYAEKHTSDVLERSQPAEVDAGLLVAFDNTPVEASEYESNLNPHLLALALTSTQSLISALFNLPTHPSDSGPTAKLPTPTTPLPREKPLPKPKPPTKWERFAKEKGISHSKKDRDVWDDDKQAWVSRWGKGGKNKEQEGAWLTEVKQKDGEEVDPRATARADRKARTAKNESQHARNVALAADPASSSKRPTGEPSQSTKKAAREQRKVELDRTLLISKTATASMGKFDKKIEGEPKSKGVKRKFEANNEVKGEATTAMDILKRVERGETSKSRKGGAGEEGGVNYRKAVRAEGREQRKSGGRPDGGKGKRGGKR